MFICTLSCTNNNKSADLSANNRSLTKLGHYLFFDTRLSYNQTKSCASCHDPKFAFTDNYRRSITASGDRVLHNAPSLLNISGYYYYDWANPAVTSLLKQSDRPMFSITPTELGMTGHEAEIIERIKHDQLYLTSFKNIFGEEKDPFTLLNIKKALEAYVRSLQALSSHYDKFIKGDSAALTISAQQGMRLFFSDKLKCASCHQPPLFTTVAITHNKDSVYFNTGLYNIHDSGSYPVADVGIATITGDATDNGKFKTPSLRNVGLTAPYTHDGSVNTLEEMIDIYQRGGRTINSGPYQGDGKLNLNKDPQITGFALSTNEKKQLIDFLLALTDSSVLVNPAFQNPFPSNK
ncbi:MAG: cytochrome c peroxidase [Chitinophagaceae bacterium]